jgi:hypothetical protein
LDPSESFLKLFHQGVVFGGSWSSPPKRLVSIVGFDDLAKPIEIVIKLIKDVKQKSITMEELAVRLESLENFKNLRNAKSDFYYKNIIPIPILLTRTFINLPFTDPYLVAKAFFEQIDDLDTGIHHRQESSPHPKFLTELFHVIQFCHLC